MEKKITPFIFTVDTSLIVAGATNGSENPLSYILPILSLTSAIVRVNDGRADISLTSSNLSANRRLVFASAGVYKITIFQVNMTFHANNSTVGIDKNKMISIDNWGNNTTYNIQCFRYCYNLEFKATNTLVLPSVISAFFAETKGFPSKDISNLDTSKVTDAVNVFANVPTKFKKLLNPFFLNLTNANGIYSGLDLSELEKLEIISNTLTTANDIFSGATRPFYGEIILQTPNLTNITALCYRFSTPPPALDKCDFRSVNNALNFLRNPMSTTNVDKTLIAWAKLPTMVSGVTWDWKGSKYSNNSEVITAYNKITNEWGVIFTNLTMA
ncbi:BspA family leucine-rich repeat surface protein [Epilithonimonas hispanica]|nr:BspA family leucine-rich repeat surface protein [Epilithonimonas hispanica]